MSAYSPCALLCGATSGCRDCQALQAINKDVQEADEMARDAKTRRSTLLAGFNSSRDLLTSTMPVEVVCCIFEEYVKLHAVPRKDFARTRPTSFGQPPIHRKGPLSLGAVCRKWRKIAWAHPPLWKALVIPLACPSNNLGPTMVTEWLRRTGMQMLDIQMHMYHLSYRGELDADVASEKRAMNYGRAIVKELNRVSARWRSLDFAECPIDVLSHLDNTGSTAPSVLRHLTLGSLCDQRRYNSVTLFNKSKHQHHPTHLALLSPLLTSRLNVGFNRLTHLHLQEMSRKHCFRFLYSVVDSTPVLLHLTFRLMDDLYNHGSDTEARNPIQFHSVSSLTIYEDECPMDTITQLLGALKLPALRSLEYVGDGLETNGFPVAQLREFLERSACTLDTLKLIKPDIDDASLEEVLRAVPTLRSLCLELPRRNQTDLFFKNLSQQDLGDTSTAQFLPNLMRLALTAPALDRWQSLVGIFVDDPTLPVENARFAPTPPKRSALQVTFTLKSGIIANGIDLKTLHQLAHIWRRYGVFAVFRVPSMQAGDSHYLLVSLRRYLWDLPQNRRNKSKLLQLEESLTLMSTLSFEQN